MEQSQTKESPVEQAQAALPSAEAIVEKIETTEDVEVGIHLLAGDRAEERPDNDQEQEQPQAIDIEEEENDEEDDEIIKHWKSSKYAIGKGKATWSEELGGGGTDSKTTNGIRIHLIISGLVCGSNLLNRERVGNMTILYQTGTQLRWVAGPLWFRTVFVTVPLIVGISLALYFLFLQCLGMWYIIVSSICLAYCLFCLAMTSLSDPGIVRRHAEPLEEDWIWSDQALTYRSPKAKYDPLCAVMIDEYDHVCPWVGTAVGAGNMRWFTKFVTMVGVNLFLNVLMAMFAPSVGIGNC